MKTIRNMQEVLKRCALGLGAAAMMGVFASGLCPGISLAAGPAGVTDSALWLDVSQLTSLTNGEQVTTWTDMSGNNRHATATGSAATYQTNALNGQPVVRFNADGNASFNFTEDSAIRTVFWVVKNTNPGTHFLLGENNYSYDFHSGDSTIWSGYTSPSILNGTTKLMGKVANGTTTALPSDSYSLLSLVTTGPVQASRLSQDDRYGINNRSWTGDMAELLIYNRALSSAEELAVGAYLANKYGLITAYPVLWLDASQLTGLTDGATVTAWTDRSGNGNHATLSKGAPTYRTNVLNGKPIIRFGTGDMFATTNLSAQLPTAATLFVVATVGSAAYDILYTGADSAEYWRYADDGKSYPAVFRSPRIDQYCLMPTTGTHLFAVSSSSSGWQMWINGVSQGVAGGSYSAGGIQNIPGNNQSQCPFAGDIAEVLEFNHVLSPAENLAVGAYLANKYGLNTTYNRAGPAGVTGVALWLDAAQLTGLADGATVTAWTDMSGNANDAALSRGAPTYRTNVLNGQPTLRFGTGDMFATTNLSAQLPTAATLFVVATVGSAAYDILDTGANADEWWRYHGDGLSYPAVFRSPRVGEYCLMPTTGTHLFAVSSSSSAWQMWINGVSQGVVSGSYNAGGIQNIPGNDQLQCPFAGDIAEVLEYNRELSAAEKLAVGAYLATKYGLDTGYNRAGPAGVTGVALWLDAAQLTGLTDGATVTAWTDRSGNANNAALSRGTPTYWTNVLNGQPIIRFGINDMFATADLSAQLPTAATLFVVATVGSAAYDILDTGTNADEWWRYHGDGLSYPAVFRSPRIEQYCLMPTAGTHLFAVSSSSSAWQMRINGISQGVAGGSFNAGGIQKIPGNDQLGRPFAGDIAEVLEYNRALSAAEEFSVGAYLANKYGLDTEYASTGITWGSAQTMTADTDVATAGKPVYAYGFYTPTTVNTVPFAAGGNSSSLSTNVTMNGFVGIHLGFGSGSAPFANLSAAYQAMTTGGIYGNSSGEYTVTLKNLTPGHTYLLQIWVDDSRIDGATRNEAVTSVGGNTVALDYNNTDAVGGVGQYVIGTFTAGGSTQTFTLNGNASGQMNALQVRDTTPGPKGTLICIF